MNLDRRTDEELLADTGPATAGPAFEALYRRHERLIVAFHVRRVGNAELAAELTAETFAQALASRERFRSRGTGSAARWLFGIAFNVLASSARSAERQRRVRDALRIEVPVLGDEALARIERAGADEEVEAALATLPAEQREAVRAYVLGEESYDEIARRAGTTQSTVRKRVSRGLATLRHASSEETS